MNLFKNIAFTEEIYFSETVKYFTDIPEINPIRNNSIIYKTITGIGATHSEIVAERHSIIVLPHISIVVSKQKDYLIKGIKTFAVHGEVNVTDIKYYLENEDGYAKFLTTPKGLAKIIKAMEDFETLIPDLNYKSLFFLLIDECHKFIKDADYRTDMVDFMDIFFSFTNKALISATPIPSKDPRFKNFNLIKVAPDYEYRKSIELVHSGSLVNGLQNYFEKNTADHYCIFFNSIEGIVSLIKHFGLTDYKIYCSKESTKKLKLAGEPNASSEVNTDLKGYNFYTSSFFNGLDIILDFQVNLIILTDDGYKSHTLLDPYADVLQIIGRFRKTDENPNPCRKITLINNTRHFTNPMSEAELLLDVKDSENVYKNIDVLRLSLVDVNLDKYFMQALTTVRPYAGLLNKEKQFSYLKLDNYLDDERVRSYYKNSASLHTAYLQTELYFVKNVREPYIKEDLIKLAQQSIGYSSVMNYKMTYALQEMEDYKGLNIYVEQREVIKQLSCLIYNAYERLGAFQIQQMKYRKSKIEKALLKLDIEEGKNSYPVINLMRKAFRLNIKYKHSYIKLRIQKVFEDYGLSCKPTAQWIHLYFKVKTYNSDKEENKRAYVFTAYEQFPVDQQQHI